MKGKNMGFDSIYDTDTAVKYSVIGIGNYGKNIISETITNKNIFINDIKKAAQSHFVFIFSDFSDASDVEKATLACEEIRTEKSLLGKAHSKEYAILCVTLCSMENTPAAASLGKIFDRIIFIDNACDFAKLISVFTRQEEEFGLIGIDFYDVYGAIKESNRPLYFLIKDFNEINEADEFNKKIINPNFPNTIFIEFDLNPAVTLDAITELTENIVSEKPSLFSAYFSENTAPLATLYYISEK